jgi:hypothetical protein
MLRDNNAPFHVAIVPIVRTCRKELRERLEEHIKAKGMVVVVPKELPESEIFVPQMVSKEFDPEVVKAWLDYCKVHKKLCQQQAVEVKGMKVIDCDSEPPTVQTYQHGKPYVALSYVWGKAGSDDFPPSTLVGENVPRTIKDAIKVTKDLGYSFLWIDNYCIDQKNDEEKRAQCARMGDIYAGSQITLFALGPDSNYGLPGVSSRPRLRRRQCTAREEWKYKFISTLPDPHLFIKKSVWATRGWTYQEGLFTTRRLFFTDHQIYFECNSMNCVETFKSNLKILHIQDNQRLRSVHRAGQFVCGNSNQYSHLNVEKSQENHRKIDTIRRYQYQIRQYTKREFSYDDDVLNAFAGIADYYAETNARILSLAGLPIPFPLARTWNIAQERLDHLSYALAWKHNVVD